MKPTLHQAGDLGVGVGLRREYYRDLLDGAPGADWLEVNTENYMPWDGGHGDRPLQVLATLREQYPVALHGLGMSLGSAEPTDFRYLERVKSLADVLEPATVSDHLCWSGVDGRQLHDLLPLPFTEEALSHVVRRIDAAQQYLGRQILVENISSYLDFALDEMTEAEFVTEVVARSGCLLLLDVNNVYVTACNRGEDPRAMLEAMPLEAVRQIHLAGHTHVDGFIIDTHSDFVADEVWDLYRHFVTKRGRVSTSIEWDSKLPSWKDMATELAKIDAILESVTKEPQRCA